MFWRGSAWVLYKCYIVKVEKKAEKLENFKTAIGSTAKSLSNSENIEISFGKQSVRSEKTTIRLPEIEQIDNKINFNQK